jgi:uncharacterized repeat protein (TIGR01451 family)
LQSTSSATAADPAPYGTDINGTPINDPIPDTEIDPNTGDVTSAPATGTSALLDSWSVTKPDVRGSVIATISAPPQTSPGQTLTYSITVRNSSKYGLSGAQVHFELPQGAQFTGTTGTAVTVQGSDVVLTLGHLDAGSVQSVEVPVRVPSNIHPHQVLLAQAKVQSSTALPVESNPVITLVR